MLVHVSAATEPVATVLTGAVVVSHLERELARCVPAVLVQVVAAEAVQHHALVQHLARGCCLAPLAVW